MSANAREDILAAAKLVAQAHGYAGLNFRDLAQQVGIKAASIYYHFPSKADLATAVAKRYWEDSAAYLESLLQKLIEAARRAAPLSGDLSLGTGERQSHLPLQLYVCAIR